MVLPVRGAVPAVAGGGVGSGGRLSVHEQQRAAVYDHLGMPQAGAGGNHRMGGGGSHRPGSVLRPAVYSSDAHIGYAPSRIFGLPTTMLWVYRLGLEHAKQFLLTGRAINAAAAYRIGLVSQVFPPGEISAAVEEEARRFRNIPANQLALNKLLINQAFENMGLRTSQMLGTFFDGMARHTEEAYRWVESMGSKGFRQAIRDRDLPWGDYGAAPAPPAGDGGAQFRTEEN